MSVLLLIIEYAWVNNNRITLSQVTTGTAILTEPAESVTGNRKLSSTARTSPSTLLPAQWKTQPRPWPHLSNLTSTRRSQPLASQQLHWPTTPRRRLKPRNPTLRRPVLRSLTSARRGQQILKTRQHLLRPMPRQQQQRRRLWREGCAAALAPMREKPGWTCGARYSARWVTVLLRIARAFEGAGLLFVKGKPVSALRRLLLTKGTYTSALHTNPLSPWYNRNGGLGVKHWAVRPNEPSGFRGRKDLLNRASALVTTCP